jgi:hypothetical protein
MRTTNLIIGFLALVMLLVIIPGAAVGLVSVWALLGCIAGFTLFVIMARYFRKGNSSKHKPDVTEDERAW